MRSGCTVGWGLVAAAITAGASPRVDCAAGGTPLFGEIRVLTDTAAREIPNEQEEGELRELSRSGRFAAFYYDVANGTITNTRLRIRDLKRGALVAETWSPCIHLFLDKDRLFLWQIDTPRPEMRVLSLTDGRQRRLSPRGFRDLLSNPLFSRVSWNPHAGEVIGEELGEHSVIYGLRLTDGRIRIVARGRENLQWSADRKRLAFDKVEYTKTDERPLYSVWMSGANGTGARKRTSGSLMAWLPGGDLLISRDRPAGGRGVYRLQLKTGQVRTILPEAADGGLLLSPSGRWLAQIVRQGRVEFIRTTDGHRLQSPFGKSSGLFWCGSDEELLYRTDAGWRRARFRLQPN